MGELGISTFSICSCCNMLVALYMYLIYFNMLFFKIFLYKVVFWYVFSNYMFELLLMVQWVGKFGWLNLSCLIQLCVYLKVNKTGCYDDIVFVAGFLPTFTLAGGINLPKIITCIGSDGIQRRQLVKVFVSSYRPVWLMDSIQTGI